MFKQNSREILVTGADGFIGSHLVEQLLELGRPVTALCQYNSFGSYGWLDPLARKEIKNLSLVLGDIRDAGAMQDLIQGHDCVFHLASLIAIPYSYHAPLSYAETNVVGTLNVALGAAKAGVRKFIHTSTSEVYGTALSVPIDETHPLQGQSPYSASKIGADKFVESCWRSFDLPAVTIRPFNTYGPRQSLRAIIPTIVSQALFGDGVIKLGSTAPTRDFNYVTDTVGGFIKAYDEFSEDLIGKTFNLGSGTEISIGDLVNLIGEVVGRHLEIQTDDQRYRPKKSEVERLVADSSLFRQATGWEPKVKLSDGLREVSRWISSRDEYSDVGRFHI